MSLRNLAGPVCVPSLTSNATGNDEKVSGIIFLLDLAVLLMVGPIEGGLRSVIYEELDSVLFEICTSGR